MAKRKLPALIHPDTFSMTERAFLTVRPQQLKHIILNDEPNISTLKMWALISGTSLMCNQLLYQPLLIFWR